MLLAPTEEILTIFKIFFSQCRAPEDRLSHRAANQRNPVRGIERPLVAFMMSDPRHFSHILVKDLIRHIISFKIDKILCENQGISPNRQETRVFEIKAK